jgi:hypothetical protein
VPSCNAPPFKAYTRDAMIRRISGLVLAVSVASAPAALTACELMCAAADASHETRTHSCHSQQPGAPISIASGVHVCGHGDALPPASGKVTAHGAPNAAVAIAAPLFLSDAAGMKNRSPRVTSSPPGPPTGAGQLRI